MSRLVSSILLQGLQHRMDVWMDGLVLTSHSYCTEYIYSEYVIICTYILSYMHIYVHVVRWDVTSTSPRREHAAVR